MTLGYCLVVCTNTRTIPNNNLLVSTFTIGQNKMNICGTRLFQHCKTFASLICTNTTAIILKNTNSQPEVLLLLVKNIWAGAYNVVHSAGSCSQLKKQKALALHHFDPTSRMLGVDNMRLQTYLHYTSSVGQRLCWIKQRVRDSDQNVWK